MDAERAVDNQLGERKQLVAHLTSLLRVDEDRLVAAGLLSPPPNSCTLTQWEIPHPGAPFPADREPLPEREDDNADAS